MTNSMIAPNKIKHALRNGETVIGVMVVELQQTAVLQALANAGFDFIFIDNEHGPFSIESIAELSRAAKSMGLTPVVRVPEGTYAHVAQSLDVGAQGIMLPRIREAGVVREVAQMMKYPPMGLRGAAFARGHTDFKVGPVAESLAQINEETLLVAQIETKESLENLDEILSVPGVDVGLIGPFDLSIALGVPGQMDAPEMVAAIEQTIAVCQKHGVAPGLFSNDTKMAAYWAERGMKLVGIGSEMGLLARGCRESLAEIRPA